MTVEKMFMKLRVLFLAVCTIFLLLGCQSGADEDGSGVEPTAVADDENTPTATSQSTEPIIGVANVDSIEVLILESFPVQINVRTRGTLPNGCTTIDDVSTEQVGNEFNVVISTIQPADAVCSQAVVPFEENIALDVDGLPAGSYQVNVNGRIGSFTLSVDNVAGAMPTAVPTPTSEPEAASELALVNGRVWHDLCAVSTADDGSSAPSEGCIALPSDEGFQANGLLEDGETGLPGVTVDLGEGACPSTGFETAETDEDGDFIFVDIPAGTYCISIDEASEANATLLESGVWTFPDDGTAETTVELADGDINTGVNFGWDYAFRPAPEVDLSNCTNSIEFVDDITVPDNTVFTPGDTFEKIWLLRNNGTCPWTETYSLAYLDGPMVPDEPTVPISTTVVAGQTIELSTTLTAPEEEGTYRTNFQLRDSNGNLFGVNGLIEEAFWVQIEVGEVAATPAPGSGTIGGVVWEDVCFINDAGTPSAGCVEIDDSGFYRADGSLNFNEGRLEGITVTLTEGGCNPDGTINAADVVATAVTDAQGLYRFTNLDENTYCVSINALSDENTNLLIPGDWTWPAPGVGRQGVILDAGEELLEVDFGWQFQ